MRLKILMELSKPLLPLDYRRLFVSFMKKGLSGVDPDKLKELYPEGKVNIKDYCFAIKLSRPRHITDRFELDSNLIEMRFSTYDMGTGIIFYNTFTYLKGKNFDLPQDNNLKATKIIVEREYPILSNRICIKLLSPLVVRKHKEDGSDYYLSYNREGFVEQLKQNVGNQIRKHPELKKSMADNLKIESIDGKKTVVNHYAQKMECSLGLYILEGHPMLLDYLYKAGIGSRRSAGFGMFEIIWKGGLE